MTDYTTTKNLVAAIRERDQRIAAMTEALLAAADREDAMNARVAALEAALRVIIGHPTNRVDCTVRPAREGCDCIKCIAAIASGGTSALDTAVAAAVAAERARIRAAVGRLDTRSPTTRFGLDGATMERDPNGDWIDAADVLAAIGGAS